MKVLQAAVEARKKEFQDFTNAQKEPEVNVKASTMKPLNIYFVGTADGAVFSPSHHEVSDDAKFQEKVADFEKLFRYLVEEKQHDVKNQGELENLGITWTMADLEKYKITWTIFSPLGHIIDSDDSDRQRKIEMKTVFDDEDDKNVLRRLKQPIGTQRTTSVGVDDSGDRKHSSNDYEPGLVSPGTYAWAIVGCPQNQCLNKKIYIKDPAFNANNGQIDGEEYVTQV
jgi:hypothetical protein